MPQIYEHAENMPEALRKGEEHYLRYIVRQCNIACSNVYVQLCILILFIHYCYFIIISSSSISISISIIIIIIIIIIYIVFLPVRIVTNLIIKRIFMLLTSLCEWKMPISAFMFKNV